GEAGAGGGGGNPLLERGADPGLGAEGQSQLVARRGLVSPGQRQLGEQHVRAAMPETEAGFAAQLAHLFGMRGGRIETDGGEIEIGVQEEKLREAELGLVAVQLFDRGAEELFSLSALLQPGERE